MSADPKSLATLAITVANSKKHEEFNEEFNDSNCDGNNNLNIKNDICVHKFRSTDEFVAGWSAAFINTTALFPINKLIFRQMAGGHKAQYAAGQMREEGMSKLCDYQ